MKKVIEVTTVRFKLKAHGKTVQTHTFVGGALSEIVRECEAAAELQYPDNWLLVFTQQRQRVKGNA